MIDALVVGVVVVYGLSKMLMQLMILCRTKINGHSLSAHA